jgi:peptidoglycan/xylan/chitin deacetylase (PgdA/CDA1 family)
VKRRKSRSFRGILGHILLFLGLFFLGACRTLNRGKAQLGLPDGYVIFTFDDGPNPYGDTTARLLEVLEKYRIRAMFALLGENVLASPELVKRIQKEGHYIINHGYDDKWAFVMNKKEFIGNLNRGESALASVLGEAPNPRYYRPQGGFYKIRQKKLWEERGYTLVPASARAYDAAAGEADRKRVAGKILRRLERQKGGIIMLHDGRDSRRKMECRLTRKPGGVFNRSWIPAVAEDIIITLRERGYRLEGFEIPRILGGIYLPPGEGVEAAEPAPGRR